MLAVTVSDDDDALLFRSLGDRWCGEIMVVINNKRKRLFATETHVIYEERLSVWHSLYWIRVTKKRKQAGLKSTSFSCGTAYINKDTRPI